MKLTRAIAALVLVVPVSASTSCTLGKPVVCAFTAIPVLVSASVNADRPASSSSNWGSDPRGILLAIPLAIGLAAAIGAAGGLVTGFVSDIQWMTGNAYDPYRNVRDPFATNTGRGSCTFRVWTQR
ncbi:MAG: hypothetical protein ACI89X_005110 [Planctomycetota bacterium]|jgi:hypothetical protein